MHLRTFGECRLKKNTTLFVCASFELHKRLQPIFKILAAIAHEFNREAAKRLQQFSKNFGSDFLVSTKIFGWTCRCPLPTDPCARSAQGKFFLELQFQFKTNDKKRFFRKCFYLAMDEATALKKK